MKIKLLLLFVMSLSLNVLAVDVGEDQKSECIYAVQSGRSNVDSSSTESHTHEEEKEPTAVTR